MKSVAMWLQETLPKETHSISGTPRKSVAMRLQETLSKGTVFNSVSNIKKKKIESEKNCKHDCARFL